eukprot:CAMPEP_0183367514 /NCGR_PEP_ID=MMETSP0164_2-20130417/92737_1 /TAXON_ID=221442 /ORGANISM="Coccolithus pelagicus ssp braarudi, Strain PLY182g" /LENGTH=246 /DNA_ID=CAMNT_0025543455 /DNA_START=42 /DNA_END=779 /DNA_ORIENTATION=-
MAPLLLMLVTVCLACSWDSHGGLELVVRATALMLLLGWPLAPSLLRFLSRWMPDKANAVTVAAAGGVRLRTLMSLCWGQLAIPAARRLERVLRIVPDGLAGIPAPSWRLKLGLLAAAVGTALPLALSISLGLAAFLRLCEGLGRGAALCVLLGWPLGPSLSKAFRDSPAHQPGRLGRARRHLFCRRVEEVPPAEDECCPICWELFKVDAPAGTPRRVEHCKWGCGRAVHSECMQMWSSSWVSQRSA